MKFFKKLLLINILSSFLITYSPVYAMIPVQKLLTAIATIQFVSHLRCNPSNPSRPEINVPLWIPASHICEQTYNHITCHWSIPQLETTQTIMIPITCTLPDCLNRPEIANILHDDQNSDQYNSSAWRYAPFYRLDLLVQQTLQNKNYDACMFAHKCFFSTICITRHYLNG